MRHRWLIRIILMLMIFATLPGAARQVSLNLAAMPLYHCDKVEWDWSWLSRISGFVPDNRVNPLKLRLCPQSGSELDRLEVVLGNMDTELQDPLVHFQLSRIYRKLELFEDADRELGLSVANSPSVLWMNLLATLGLVEY